MRCKSGAVAKITTRVERIVPPAFFSIYYMAWMKSYRIFGMEALN
jgi:hypothetical protein